MKIAYCIIISLAMTNAVANELVFDWFRNLWCSVFDEERSPKLHYLVSCPVCLGFWVGLLVGGIVTIDLLSAIVVASATSFIGKIVLIWEEKR